jgi:hypothetical protein
MCDCKTERIRGSALCTIARQSGLGVQLYVRLQDRADQGLSFMYGCKTERISMEEAIKRGVATKEQVGLVYTILAKVADTFYATDAKKEEEAYAESSI